MMYSTSGKKVWILLENFCVLTYERTYVHMLNNSTLILTNLILLHLQACSRVI